ncbi:MAG: plasmid pRiA4b ORF-3 family protein [Bacteroidales bacterium]|nr:plasmid pRiA4b ORF-3 family protein [Bacteroidales bacterium]MBD5252791.1 plasmid pRiA4b ORF-3 family protein [Barnesiella sp.]
MAKMKKWERKMANDLLNAIQGGKYDDGAPDMNGMEQKAHMAMGSLSDDKKGEFALMYTLASNGVTPEEYAQFYNIFHASDIVAGAMSDDFDADDANYPVAGNLFDRGRCEVREYQPLEDAAERTLVLKIQMKGIAKPPMWREVEIPADYNFMQLHEVIQAVMGLDDHHLWQFNKKAYDDTLQIGFEMDEECFGPGLDYITHDAEETLVSKFLQKKGDKLEYVYDFGDDWIFVVEVKDLVAKKIEYPVCMKFKSELNAIDDFGGIWAYEESRRDLKEWGKLSEKEKKQRMEVHGFDTEDEYLELLNSHRISLDDINEALMFI